MHRLLTPAILLIASLAIVPAVAQDDPGAGPRVTGKAHIEPATASPGDEVTLIATLQVQDGWHVYGSKQNPDYGKSVALTVTDLGGLRLIGETQVPPGEEHDWSGLQMHWLMGSFELKQRLKVPADHAGGEAEVQARIEYAACDDSVCEQPATLDLTAKLQIEGDGTAPTSGPGDAEPAAQDPLGGIGLPGQVAVESRIVPEGPLQPGDEATLEVTLRVPPGRHIYGSGQQQNPELGLPTKLMVTAAGGLRLVGEAQVPTGEKHDSPVGDQYWLGGDVVLRQGLRVPAEHPGGTIEVEARVDYMSCTESYCDPEANATVAERVEVAGDGAGAGSDEQPAEDELISFAAAATPGPARAGERVDVIVRVEVAAGWHVYGARDANPVTLRASDPGGLIPEEGNRLPDGVEHRVDDDLVNYWLDGTFEIAQSFRVPEGAEPGERTLQLAVQYQLCDDDGCLLPTSEELELPVVVESGEARAEYLSAPPKQPRSVWATIIGGILAGLFALLMPCTYPMIPITISFFTKRAQEEHTSTTSLALAYGAGIVLMFIAIGLFIGPPIINFATHWVTNGIITAAFLYFALALFGVVSLEPPRALRNLADKSGNKGGFGGVFLMGATLVVSSFTCTVPFAGTMLSVTAAGGLDRIVIGMAAFGATMAAPFVILSLLPGRLGGVPRAGGWMNTLKVWLGFVELAAALKFLSNVDMDLHGHAQWITRDTFLWVWTAIFVAAAIYLLAPLVRRGVSLRPVRIAGALFTVLIAGWSGRGAVGGELDDLLTAFAPPPSKFVGQHEIVVDDYPAALTSAREQDRLLLVNFTGLQCVNCRLMEQKVFPTGPVAEQLEDGYVEARLHINYKENSERMQRRVGFVASPHFVVIDPATERTLGEFDLTGTGGNVQRIIPAFADFLRSLRSPN